MWCDSPVERFRTDKQKPLKNQGFSASSRVLPVTIANTGDGTRTHDLRIMRPQPSTPNALKDKDLRQETKAVSHHFPTGVPRIDAGLAAVIEAWDRLPNALRAGIVAIVNAART
jgi:hypothetical protein